MMAYVLDVNSTCVVILRFHSLATKRCGASRFGSKTGGSEQCYCSLCIYAFIVYNSCQRKCVGCSVPSSRQREKLGKTMNGNVAQNLFSNPSLFDSCTLPVTVFLVKYFQTCRHWLSEASIHSKTYTNNVNCHMFSSRLLLLHFLFIRSLHPLFYGAIIHSTRFKHLPFS